MSPGSCDTSPRSHDTSTGSYDTSTGSHDTSLASCDYVTEETDVIELFRDDFAAARDGGVVEKAARSVRQVFGHRAGSDAFMTGYAFGCYAVTSSRSADVASGEELCGLKEMRNSLASRPATWKVPLQILKSRFVKTSSTHSVAQERLAQAKERWAQT